MSQPTNPIDLPAELEYLADQMEKLGRKMEYYGGFSEIAQHGLEMQGAANIARGWAKGIRKESHEP